MKQKQDLMATLREQDIGWRFLETRKIFLWGPIEDELSKDIVSKLLLLESEDPNQDIMMYLNSPGGTSSAGMAIYDAMQSIRPDLSMICMGLAASMGAILLAGGTNGKRYSWPHSRIMIHQPMLYGEIYEPAANIAIRAQEIIRLRDEINLILSQHTGQPKEVIERDTARDFFMSAEEAKAYGLIDEVLVDTLTNSAEE